jgi:hypothetical protein
MRAVSTYASTARIRRSSSSPSRPTDASSAGASKCSRHVPPGVRLLRRRESARRHADELGRVRRPGSRLGGGHPAPPRGDPDPRRMPGSSSWSTGRRRPAPTPTRCHGFRTSRIASASIPGRPSCGCRGALVANRTCGVGVLAATPPTDRALASSCPGSGTRVDTEPPVFPTGDLTGLCVPAARVGGDQSTLSEWEGVLGADQKSMSTVPLSVTALVLA